MEQYVSAIGGLTRDALELFPIQGTERLKPSLEQRSKGARDVQALWLLRPDANRILPLRLCRIHDCDDGLNCAVFRGMNFVCPSLVAKE
jgi:hypothetical protein